MHLVTPLVSGIAGAENGTVDFYRRGAAGTYVTYYTSFEGDGATTPTSSVDLDSSGGGVFYVNEEALCVVKDSGGTTVRSFVAGSGAPSVEVISPSFTGTDYSTAATGESKPLTLAALLDLWVTNAGAKDFKVDIGGVATTLQEAFSVVGAAFINVKSEAYGAVGDGTTNDTAAIQAALDAASAASGGTVFFPKGTYKTTAALTVAANVSLQGIGPAASIIALAHGSANVLTLAAANTNFTSIVGLKVGASQANTGATVSAVLGRKLKIDNCWLGNPYSSQSFGVNYDTADTIVFITNTTFELDTSAGVAVRAVTSTVAATAHVWGCRVQFSGAHTGNVFQLACGSVIGTEVDCAGKTSGASGTVFSFGNVAGGMQKMALVLGCSVSNPTGGTISAWAPASNNNEDGRSEFGNRFGSAITFGDVGGAPSKATYFGQHSLLRDRGRSYTLDDTAAVTVFPTRYGLAEVERTTTGAQTCTFDLAGANTGPVLEDFVLIYNNLAQGSVTGTISIGPGVVGLSSFTVNANCYSAYFFKAIHYGTASRWALFCSLVNQT